MALVGLLITLDAGAQTPTAPGAPAVDPLIAGETWVGVTWTAPTETGGASITTYDLRHIEASADKSVDSNWTVVEDVWTTGSGDLAYVLTGLTNGTAYDVQVLAVNSAGDGAWSSTVSATPADYGNNLNAATELILNTWSDGSIHPFGSNSFHGNIGSATDEDWFKIELTDVHAANDVGIWLYTRSDIDTVGELQNSDGEPIREDDYGAVLPNTEDFFIWDTLEAGTYYLKVSGYGSGDTGDYVLRVRTFRDTLCPTISVTLPLGRSASGMLDPERDHDCFRITLTESADVILRSSGFPDTVGHLLNSGGSEITSNDDGFLVPGVRNFLIRQTLSSGTYYLRVRSFGGRSDGPFTVYAYEATEPGSSTADATPLTLGVPAGGNIASGTDEDYFSITVDEGTYVRIYTAKNSGDVDTDGALLDHNGNAVTGLDYAGDFSGVVGFGIEHKLENLRDDGPDYYIRVTGDSGTGKYTIRATEDVLYQDFVDTCTGIGSSSGFDDDFYGCQWHLNNTNQFPDGAGQDINVEDAWTIVEDSATDDYIVGDGIRVAVVDDGMHHQHEDLTNNVDRSSNHDYRPGQNDIYSPGRNHGTSVAGLIAARDNSDGIRGVAPRVTIYGYNYLAYQSNANEANAMSRNAATTAVSNNSWGPNDGALPEPATSLWENAVETGVTSGYGGKGVVYVWSGGNGARDGDYSNLDEYNNLYAVTSVCAVNHDDKRTSYSEAGSNLWLCAPSSDRLSKAPGIATTDNGNRYRDDFGGTSAAAPIVSGVVALMRDANGNLTWRDVKLILAASARQNDTSNTGWQTGATKYGDTGSYDFNHEYGFGVVDAKAAVDLANTWTNLPPLRTSTVSSGTINLSIPDAVPGEPLTTVSSKLTLDTDVEFIEYVEVDPHFNHTSFRDLNVELTSPSGNVSTLSPYFGAYETEIGAIFPRARLNSPFRFGSARHLGEDAAGEWTLRITDHVEEDQGTLRSWSITVYGHRVTPSAPDIEDVFPASGGYTVTWKAPTDTGQSAISSYDVRHILSSATDADKADDNMWTEGYAGNPDTLQYTTSELMAGVRYDVQVRAVNDGGDGLWSETETVTPKSDEVPTIEIVTPGNGMLTVMWTEPTSATLGTITAYDLRYGRGSSPSSWTTVDDAWTSGTLEYTIIPTPALTNGVTYGIQVRAVVGTDDKEWSETRTGTPRTVPGAPSIDAVDGDDGSLLVKWNAPTDNGGAAVTSYDVRYIQSDATDKTDGNWSELPDFWTTGSGSLVNDFSGVDNWIRYDVQVRAVNPAGAGDWSATQTGTPVNTHVNVTLQWETTSDGVGEEDGFIDLTAIVTTNVDEAVPDDFFFVATVTTDDGTAESASDYVPLPPGSTLRFEYTDFSRMEVNGRQRYQASKSLSVAITPDMTDETDETFTVTLALANPDVSNFSLRNATTTVTIEDDEHVPVTLGWLNETVSVSEGSGTVALNATATTTVNKRPESGFSFQATVATSAGTATAADDYTHVSTTVTFQHTDSWSAVGSGANRRYRASKRITVPIINDTADERDETFTATVDYVDSVPIHLTGGSATATVTIEDNDLPQVSIASDTSTAGEDGTLTFRLTRDGITDNALPVNVRVSETGRMLASNPPAAVTFPAGNDTVTLDVALNDDAEDEDNSVITVTVRSGSGYAVGKDDSATATALDDDHVPVTLSWDRTAVTASERAGTVTLRAVATTTKDKAPESGFSFGVNVTYANGTAQSADYSGGPTSATFSQSVFSRTGRRYQATKDFTINIASGDGDEADETFTATLAYAADPLPPYLQGNSPTATVTITDDDDPLVTISADDSSVTEAEDSITFTVVRDGDAASSLSVNVDVEETGGNMLARPGRYTVSFAAGSSSETLTVNLRDDT